MTDKESSPIGEQSTKEATTPGKVKRTFVSFAKPRKPWAVILTVVLLLLLAAGLLFSAVNNDSSQPQEVVTEEGVVLRQLSNEELFDQVDRLVFQEKYSSAEQLINFQESADSYELQLLLATTYTNRDAPEDALRVLRDIEEHHPENWQIAKYIGQTYEQLDNKGEALEYYKRAHDLVQEADDVPIRDDEILLLRQDITRLNGVNR